jgi:nicotinate phosphoribosyltransferase
MLLQQPGLYTDFYELTMAQGYFLTGKHETPAVFDYFFRKLPFDGGYVVFCGLDELLGVLENYRFTTEDLEYLDNLGFKADFLKYLSDFRFKGTVHSVNEGEIVFPYEPILCVSGTLLETQLVETLVLNILNFQSLIATKASRIKRSSGDRPVIDFGLRRAQGLAGIQASRAAVVGGIESTSNTFAGKLYTIPVSGTQAHSWIGSFSSELEAFRSFARIYEDRCILLVDTYDTLKSGVPNAITVGKELEKRGNKLWGVRLDSGDLSFLSKKTRDMLDKAGLNYVKIIASNQLDEYIIRSLNEQKAPFDAFGVGTQLVIGRPDAALDGVYKLCFLDGKPRLKISENKEKVILPGEKKIVRLIDDEGYFAADAISLKGDKAINIIHHIHFPEKTTDIAGLMSETLHQVVMRDGKRTEPVQSLSKTREYALQRLTQLPEEHLRFENPHIYKVGITSRLLDLRTRVIDIIRSKI